MKLKELSGFCLVTLVPFAAFNARADVLHSGVKVIEVGSPEATVERSPAMGNDLECSSKGVMDAGYIVQASLNPERSDSLKAKVLSVSGFGSKATFNNSLNIVKGLKKGADVIELRDANENPSTVIRVTKNSDGLYKSGSIVKMNGQSFEKDWFKDLSCHFSPKLQQLFMNSSPTKVQAGVDVVPHPGFEKQCLELFPSFKTTLSFEGQEVTIPSKIPMKAKWDAASKLYEDQTLMSAPDIFDYTGPIFKATFDGTTGEFSYWDNFLSSGQATGKSDECKARILFQDPQQAAAARKMVQQK